MKKYRGEVGISTPQEVTVAMAEADQIMDTAGPQVIENDVGRARRWALASGNTFYTYPHYDAAGFCTWSMLSTGTKVWSYLRPKVHDEASTTEASQTILQLAGAAATSESTSAPEEIPKLATAHNLFLTPGTLL